MAQYFTDFQDQALGTGVSGWTNRWASATWEIVEVSGEKFVRVDEGSNNWRLLSWDLIDADTARHEVETVALVTTSNNNNATHNGAAVRASGSLSTKTGYHHHFTEQHRVARELNGDFTALATAGAAPASWTRYWCRFRVNGTSLKYKYWEENETEPASWLIETTDTEVSAAGWVGLFFLSVREYRWYKFGVGTNGDTAPVVPVDVGGVVRTGSGQLRTGSGLLRRP